MGNTHTKEERANSHHSSSASATATAGEPGSNNNLSRSGLHRGESATARRPSRPSRPDLTSLGISLASSSSSRRQDVPFERRETKQEREARKLEKERAARLKERERSIREEHVDGGYLVTMGIYTATEDFNKSVVRQLQIERKIAPFWRGLDDFENTWAEHQIIAAARGLEIPPADQVPEHLVPQPQPRESPEASSSNLNNLTVPIGARTLSASSDGTTSYPGSTLPSSTTPATPKVPSPLKQPKKALAAALNLSRNNSQAEIAPHEINLPHDPFVNGQALEVFLYKEGEECPLCLMYYPPYLNRTRCCCQLICSECFVQIKRPEPHFPEHHVDGVATQETQPDADERLVMEPAKCPYCTQPDFGVTYEPPPFRRGLVYAFPPSNLGTVSTAMSSSSSVNSNLSPAAASSSVRPSRGRAQSLSANAPGVVTADRLRPDWAGKLATARAHQLRRAAAADALHHAAFVMGNPESRTLFARPSRFSRRATGSYRRAESPDAHEGPRGTPPCPESGPGSPPPDARGGLHRERIAAADLENLMMAEAIRLSLADEEERRKKADKEARKEAKKQEKEERKAAKKKGDVYGSRSASTSSLSLGLGRRRNNSGAGNLRVEASVAAATVSADHGSDPRSSTHDKGKGVQREEATGSSTTSPVLTPQVPRGMSHLRQMSNASSISSDGIDSMPGSYIGKNRSGEDPHGSALSLGGQSDQAEGTGSEPLFNFRSLAEVVGVSIDGEGGSLDDSFPGPQTKSHEHDEAHSEHVEHGVNPDPSVKAAEARGDSGLQIETVNSTIPTPAMQGTSRSTPDVVVTPNTPAPADDDNDDDEDSKGLGHPVKADRAQEVTQ